MIEVIPRLFIGNQADYEETVANQEGWWVVHACKEPYHRRLLGYTGHTAPKDHPEYLMATRDKELFLNLVDVDNPAYVAKEIMVAALQFIDQGLQSGDKVLVHCNQGESRSPSIGLHYLVSYTDTIPFGSLEEAEEAFRKMYPSYMPKGGMRGYLLAHWDDSDFRAVVE